MPRKSGGGGFSSQRRAGGNTRRVRKKGKNTYAAKQARWRASRPTPAVMATPADLDRPAFGRKNKPKDTPQKKKPPGRGGRGGKGGKR